MAGRWADVGEASRELGISSDAVRKRISRGSLRSERTDEGVRVWLDDGGTEAGREAQGEGGGALVEVLRDQVTHLRSELAEEREARRRADTILAQLSAANAEQARTIRELEAPETVEEASEGAEPQSAAGEAREELGAERARREEAEATLHEGMAEERRRREEAERERDGLRRELFALRGQEGAHEAAEEQQGRSQPHSATGGAQEGARRPWWRRMFDS